MDILADLRRREDQCLDMLVLSSFEDAVSELERYKQFGGTSLIDVTVPGIGRDVKALHAISEATGINVICGTGWYLDASHPTFVKQSQSEMLVEHMVKELDEGIDGTEVRAGVIGEIGCSKPLTPNEEKVLASAAKAQILTKAPITVHTALYDVEYERHAKQTREELEILQRNGADMSKVYVSHMDWTLDDLGYQERIMEDYEVTLAYDSFGQEQYYDNIYWGCYGVTDKERIEALTEFLRKGFERQLMMSCDVCEKIHLRKYGGWGYSHILEHICPALKRNGISDRQIRTMTVDNPRRLFSR
jgi:phosphotriesterase-related protein